MDTNNKFSKFVAKLEKKMLDGNHESMILIGPENVFGGTEINGRCTNTSDFCEGSMNTRRCTNSNGGCSGSDNGNKCANSVILSA